MFKYILVLLAFAPFGVEARVHTVLTKYTIQKFIVVHHKKDVIEPIKEVRHIKRISKTKFDNIVTAAAAKHKIDENLIHAIIQTESAYTADAESPKGAVGAMQLMPDTAKRFGCKDRNDPTQNINGGTRYLKHLFTLFDDLKLVVAAYNAGENAVIRYGNKIPPYPETQQYVKLVMARI